MKRFASYALAAVLAAAPALAGAQVWGTAADMSGSRSISGGGLVAGDPGYTSLNISWSIVQEGNLLRYTYTFSGLSPVNQISHAILSLSPGCAAGCITGVTGGTAEFGTFDGSSPANPNMPNSISGVKINTTGDASGNLVYSFLTDRAPVWGDIYVKGSNNLYSYNVGLESANRLSNDVNFFIARPDTQPMSTVPEPSTYALMGSGLLGIAAAARRRRTV